MRQGISGWIERRFERELVGYAVAGTFALLLLPILLITSAFVDDLGWALGISLPLTLVAFFSARSWLRRVLARPISNTPTEKPLSSLSEYELALEREKAEQLGDQRRLEAIRTARAFPGRRE